MRPQKYIPYNDPFQFFITPYNEVRPLYFYDLYDFKYIVPECFLFISLLLLLFFGSLYFKNTKNESNVILTAKVLLVIFGLTFLLLLNNLYLNTTAIIFYEFLAIENFSTVIKLVVLLLTTLIVLSGKDYMQINRIYDYDYLVILGFVTIGLFMILSAHDFMSLFLAIELVGYGLYTLANLKRDSTYGAEASLKYYVTGMLATGFYAYGASLVYLQTKTLNFFVLQLYIYNQKIFFYETRYDIIMNKFDFTGDDYTLLVFGLTLILVLLLFKIAAAPFHVWSPDVYEGVPMIVTAYYSIVIKFVMLITFLKIVYFILPDFIEIFRPAFIFVSVISVLMGSIGAAFQDKLKRVFAYSSISHIGYVVMGLIPGTETGFIASLVYVFIYIIGNVILFNFLLSTSKLIADEEESYVAEVSDLAKIGISSPLLGIFFSCSLFSFAGIPPFAGFFAKLGIFYSLLSQGYGFVVLVAFVGTAISCFYYLKLIKASFFVPAHQPFFFSCL